ncbi:anti-sigma F factor antagonist [Ructibacterium gallinarum]|uniref:Anti-sigma F factor antagonist n=1 Tax=Ructibacterium gallinarum TaxID=2779355 RepID=A0A9D5LZR3_9FIRM|nr:anti-sigma F factor antagonist [Ructibacterium gallinarum]MBE5041058.1 anti-sigma F factor antagonist [Ructibacterium gallinarum]
MRMEYIGTTLVVKLEGEIDQSCAAEIRTDIDRAILLKNAKNLILDFAGVSFMDSSGIGVIIGRYKQMKARGGKTMIIRTQPQVDKILELSGLKKIMDCG